MARTLALCALALAVALPVHAATAPPVAATATKDFAVPYPVVQVPAASSALANEIRQGEYLTKLSDCMACHTDHDRSSIKGRPFAGGLPMQTPFGVIYSLNITPDKETGIGSWTFKQFDDAVRYGESPRGFLFAAMPYTNYNIMSKAQVHAIWEYLKRVPAVHEMNKPLGISAPFSWRWLQFGWRFLFYKPGEGQFKPDPNHSAAWNRGRFIVHGPEHCGACHSPHNLLGGEEKRHFLQGSDISGAWAPNISALATAPHSAATIARVFRDAKGLAGGALQGPMLDAISNSMHYMAPADMHAVAVYIQSVSSEPAAGPRPVSMGDVDLALGAKTYQDDCASCHDAGIAGAPRIHVAADWKPLAKVPLYILYENVWHGVSIMPPKGGCGACTPRQITSAIVYILDQSRPGATAPQPAAAGGEAAGTAGNEVGLALGKQTYQQHCAACHASGLAGAPRYGDEKLWATRLKKGLDVLHRNALDGIGAMPPKGGCASCTKDQIISAVDYLVAGSGGKQMVEKSLSGKNRG